VSPVRNVFEAKSSRIVRVLLTNPDKTWILREIAKESQVSLGMAYYVTSALIQMALATRDETNRVVLTDPHRLLRQWAASHNYLFLNMFSEYYTFDTELQTFFSRLARVPAPLSEKYALTLHAAAWTIAPYVRPNDFHIYIRPEVSDREEKKISKSLNISPVEKTGNVKLVTPYDEGVFYNSIIIKKIRIVSPVQLYVDLFNHPGRGEEAAEKILAKVSEEWRTKPAVRQR